MRRRARLPVRRARPRHRTPAPSRPFRSRPARVPVIGASRTAPSGTAPSANRADDLALLLDLLAAALAVGAPLVSALDAVAAACPGTTSVDLERVRELMVTGRFDESAEVPGAPPALVRALRRSGHSGSRLAEQLRLVADDLRAESAAAALDSASRVGIWAVLPLGLCCLPAFVALAVVPLAYGLLRDAVG